MPDDPAAPVVPAPCFFIARGPWVRPSPGIPCALFDSGGENDAQLGCDRAAGMLTHTTPLSCAALSGASSTPRFLGSLAGASGILGRPVKPGDDSRRDDRAVKPGDDHGDVNEPELNGKQQPGP